MACLAAKIAPSERGNLVISGPTSTKTPAQVSASTLHEATFEGGMHVLVLDSREKIPGQDVLE